MGIVIDKGTDIINIKIKTITISIAIIISTKKYLIINKI